ncbi:MAG TPA: hypothetical protein VGX25_23880, partial [Actinophytocola sp.]|nr:hypothetical protein [Actinophytocola sp.]
MDTGEDVREQAEQDVNSHDESTDGGFLGIQDLIELFTRNGRIDEQTRRELDAQAAQLAAGLPTRPAPPIDAANYLSYDHGQLKTMVTENADPGTVGSTGDLWIEAGNEMIQFQERVASAINSSESDWQGTAANQARGFMASVGNWVGTAGQSAALAGTQTNLQSEALSAASSSMPEEVPWDREAWIQRIQTSSDPLGTYMDALDEYNRSQEAHQQAARVVTTYDNGLSGASTMPAFTAPPTMAGEGGSTDTGKGDSDGVGRIGGDSTGPGGTGSGSGGSGTGAGGGGGGGSSTLPGVLGGPGGPGTGGGSGSGQPPGGTNPGGTPGLPGGPGGPGGGPGLPGGGGPGGGNLPPGAFPIGGGPIGGVGGDTLRPGGGRGGSGFGPGGGRGFGPGGGSGSGSGFGSGSGSGAGSGAGSGSGSGAGGGRGAGGGMGAGAL